ncbi:MAG: hypothetical protein ACI4RT_03880 [Candidatus Spyradenecus sp.]
MAKHLFCLTFGLCLLAIAHAQQPSLPKPIADRFAKDPQAYFEWEQRNRQQEEGFRALRELRDKAANNKVAKEVELAEADAWAAKLLQLTPEQVNAWMNAPVKDEATFAQIAATSDAQLEAAERGAPAEPPPARRWGALGVTVALLLAWAIWKHIKKGERD